MEKYHKYIFDLKERSFVGAFEEMYATEDKEGFDSWYESDLRPLRKQICLAVLNQYNHASVLELGCGKGTFTQFLKKENNSVTAIDLSETAIAKARASYPDVEFRALKVQDLVQIPGTFELGVVMGTLAYVEDWESVLEGLGDKVRRCLVAEYVPTDAIGFVKSVYELTSCFDRYFTIINKVILDDEHCILFGASRIVSDP